MIAKPKNMLCGPACIYFICKTLTLPFEIPNDMQWITQLATFAEDTLKLPTVLSCYKSNLYNDFSSFPEDNYPPFEGFKHLSVYLKKHKILNQVLTTTRLKKYLNDGYFIILNVSSAVFNNDTNMSGGHYILITGYSSKHFKVINPLKDSYAKCYIHKKKILLSCKPFGSWALAIKKHSTFK